MTAAGDPADDEFRFLADDAKRIGRSAPLPEVRRISLPDGEGRTISALAFSPEDPPELAALHGAGLNAHSFDPMLLALARPALAVDLPGHGRSDWRSDADYRPQTIAPAVAHALAAAGVSAEAPVHLVGHSLGGLVAAIVAASSPELVSRLTLVDITPGVARRAAAAAVPGPDDGADPDPDAAAGGPAPGAADAPGAPGGPGAPDAPGGPGAPDAPGGVAEFITGQRDYGSIEEIVDRAVRFGIGSDRAALTRGVALNTRRRPDGRLEWTHHLAHLNGLPGGVTAAAAESPGDAATDPAEPLWLALAGLSAAGLRIGLVRADQGMVDDSLETEWRERLPRAAVVTVAGPHNLHEACPGELAAALRD
ncbi:alpha/beta fold hydrolase [Leucobacter sp. CSA2]|uniref:Alpha/beta fold hydrolase n=1 Tax=Leucobacter edaphi TaxID=2796472 RepID=A0A934UWW4_9MICO|nr:alpha/beta fold hydrolase [Leucobacter edaphi]MBK0420966.1 alpha/beta fold hydrolase [Leucobacter edaphi]